MSKNFEVIIGLETHVRVKSITKMFDAVPNSIALEKNPNINVSPVSMGFPGALPVLSEGVVDKTVRAAHGMKMHVNEFSQFDRKSYFYPDLPMSYQITQLYHPIASGGEIQAFVDKELKTFRIERMHIEADAGKLTHSPSTTLLDYNRAAAPLMEIVTEPDFRSKYDVMEYLKELQKIMRFTWASDADMEKWQMRCDVNISIRPEGQTELNPRVEMKNLNSFQMIGRAIDAEVKRQKKIYESGEIVDQETRGWDDDTWVSKSQRSKEDAMDYRYFPEPDLPPLMLTTTYIEERASDKIPMDRRLVYLNEYKLQDDDARILSRTRDICDFFDEVVSITNDPKKSSTYIGDVLMGYMKETDREEKFDALKFDAKQFAHVINLLKQDELSSNGAQEVIRTLFLDGWDPDTIIKEKWLKQVNDTSLMEAIVEEVIKKNPEQVEQYRSGKEQLFWFFVGQCMAQSKGQWNPKIFTQILTTKLNQ